MALYFFHFEAVKATPVASLPLDGEEHVLGHVDVWIAGDIPIQDAEVRARGVLMGEAWAAQSMPIARGWDPGRIGELDREGQILARRALHKGASSTFVAWPEEETIAASQRFAWPVGNSPRATRH